VTHARAEQRLRFTFSKTGATRYIGHLDLARTFERAFNRANLPVLYSHGFNRRPKMQFAAALPLGFSSRCELVDVWLLSSVEPDLARQRLVSRMAPGLAIQRVEEVPLTSPPLQTLTREATYEVAFIKPPEGTPLVQRVARLMAADSLTREHVRGQRRKVYDLRPLIITVLLNERVPGQTSLLLRLCLMEARNGRPDEVLRALGIDPMLARIERTEIVLAQPEAQAD